MESLLKIELQTKLMQPHGRGGGGCISSGQGYQTDHGIVFVKQNGKKAARLMFDGEEASLNAILATNTVRCPKPLKVLDDSAGGSMIVMEYMNMASLTKHSPTLGTQLAQMHLHNIEACAVTTKQQSSVHKQPTDTDSPEGGKSSPVTQFGFHTTTCCGFLPQDNTWEDDWCTFYTRRKLKQQFDMVSEKYSDREAGELWSQLQLCINDYFRGIDIQPSLVHGDLWGGNVAQDQHGPLIFDAACFYGHHEYEMGIITLFGGFDSSFYRSYHKLIPAQPGSEKRIKLYNLFHYMNHWNHFGGGYRGSSLNCLREILKK